MKNKTQTTEQKRRSRGIIDVVRKMRYLVERKGLIALSDAEEAERAYKVYRARREQENVFDQELCDISNQANKEANRSASRYLTAYRILENSANLFDLSEYIPKRRII